MKPFTKALLNMAAGGTVQHFENCAGLVHRVVCGISFLTTTTSSSSTEPAEDVKEDQRFPGGKLVTSPLELRPCRTRFFGILAQRIERARMLLCGMQFVDLPRTSRESCVCVLANDRPLAASALTSSRATAIGVEQGLIQFVILSVRLFGRLAKILDVLGIAILGMMSLRYSHLDGGDTDTRSGRVKLLQQYPSPG